MCFASLLQRGRRQLNLQQLMRCLLEPSARHGRRCKRANRHQSLLTRTGQRDRSTAASSASVRSSRRRFECCRAAISATRDPACNPTVYISQQRALSVGTFDPIFFSTGKWYCEMVHTNSRYQKERKRSWGHSDVPNIVSEFWLPDLVNPSTALNGGTVGPPF